MKKVSLVFLAVLFVVLFASGLQAAAAPAGQAAPDQPIITVTGHAETSVAPDMAMITTGITTTGSDVESARTENNRIMHRLIDALLLQGIERSKITTTQFSLQPVYRQDKNGGLGAIIGYTLQNNITIVVEDLAKIGPVIDTAFRSGANQFQGLRFGLKDDSLVRDELLKKAVLDGKHKAAIIATAMGRKLVQPLSVSESGQYASDGFRALAMKSGAMATPIEAGSLNYSIDVNMVFEF